MKRFSILLLFIFLSTESLLAQSSEDIRITRQLAKQGDARARFMVGLMYLQGRGGVPQDYAQAAVWFRLAADQGDASAQYSLGNIYREGEGVPQDDVQAVKWFRLAADQGNGPAQYNLGDMFAQGKGVPQDDVQAMKWYRLAADQGNEYGKKAIGIYGKKMSPQQIAQADELARNWKPKK